MDHAPKFEHRAPHHAPDFYSRDPGRPLGVSPADEEGPQGPWAGQATPTSPRQSFGWGRELLALVVSAAALAAVAVVLNHYDTKRLDSWALAVSPSSLIAILSVVFRLGLMYGIAECLGQGKWDWFRRRIDNLPAFATIDRASRGVFGSLKLLWWSKFCNWLALGATAVVALLAVEPLLQAAVQFVGQSDRVGTDTEASITKATWLDVGLVIPEMAFTNFSGLHGTTFESLSPKPDLSMNSAMLAGFINSSSPIYDTAPFRCQSGNCTWPAYASLGVCATCADITSSIIKTEAQDSAPQVSCPSYTAFPLVDYTMYSLPGEYSSVKLQVATDFLSTADRCIYPSRVLTAITTRPEHTINFAESKTLLGSFALMTAPQSFWEGNGAGGGGEITATECALHFCAQVFQSSSQNGVLRETAIYNSTAREPNSFRALSAHANGGKSLNLNDTVDNVIGNSLDLGHPDFWNGNGTIPFFNITDLQITLPAIDGQPPLQDRFNITLTAIATMQSYFKESDTLLAIGQALEHSSNFSASFETAARTISNRMRILDGNTTAGDTEQWALHIRVQWWFLAYPAAVLLLSVVFIFGTILRARSSGSAPLKSSATAVLLHGFDDQIRAYLLAREGNSVEKLARDKGLLVRLDSATSRLQLVSHDSEK